MFTGKDIDYSAATIRNDGFWPMWLWPTSSAAAPCLLTSTNKPPAPLCWPPSLKSTCSHQAALQAKGYASAAYCGTNALTEQYLAAVFARAKAAILPEFASVTERPAANNQVERAPELRAQLAESQQLSIKGKHGRECH
ncbi:head completion/stabilization protein [Aeromonas hydrophila]|nr:head completion/stabilization protein [Aeromonas hydrophila]